MMIILIKTICVTNLTVISDWKIHMGEWFVDVLIHLCILFVNIWRGELDLLTIVRKLYIFRSPLLALYQTDVWLIDKLKRHFNPPRVISCLVVREYYSLYIDIHIFCVVFPNLFFFLEARNYRIQIILKLIYLTH